MRHVWLTLVLLATPHAAWACPACAGREGGGLGLLPLYAGMILFPFLIAYVVYRVIRHTLRDSHEGWKPESSGER